jgi:hypothetical protein
MKSSMKGLFVILAIVMSLVAVQTLWAKGGLDCTTVVKGNVSEIWDDFNAIIVEDDKTVYGIPLPWLDIKVGDDVLINAHECPDTGKLMACYLTINEGEVIDLRPRGRK